MEDFKFDLQRFADGDDGVTDDNQTVEQDTNEPEVTTNEPDGYDFGDIALDEQGNLVFPEDNEPSEQTPAKPDNPQQDQVKPYTPEEVAQVGIEKLDPTRIPAELQPFYKSMQADYTRKTQRLAEQQKQFENNRPAQSVPQTPPVQQPKPQEYIKQIADTAIVRAKASLGLAPDEAFDEYNPIHQAAFNIELNNIYSRAAAEQRTRSKWEQLANNYQQNEPNFAQIDGYCQERLMNLPAKDYLRVRQAVQTGNIPVVQQFIEDSRKEWYAKQNGVQTPTPQKAKPKPPVVESGGQGNTNQQPKRPDFNALRQGNGNMDATTKWLVDNGLV